jgi:His-Xaa-Ser system radical SAM maturase HxsC
MLTLGSSNIQFHNFGSNTDTLIIRLSDDIRRPNALRENEAFLIHPEQIIPTGFKLYLLLDKDKRRFSDLPPNTPLVILPGEYNYLGSGDIVRLSPEKNAIRVLYRRKSKHNSFLTTERCNNYCLMCSQPPRNVEDTWIVNEILQSIPLINVDTKELGFTGGEPTLLGEDLIRILNMCKSWLPHTGIHILSNGRNFANPEFTEKYAAVKHPDLMVGIPLYSDLSTIHDYVVQADGAYDETIRGILNLKRLGQKVEIRVVLHKQTYNRLPQLAEFIVRNLLFVDHIALMGLEMMGFTKANIDDLWVDPYD